LKDIHDQCVSAGVPFHFKQRGGVHKVRNGRQLKGRIWDEMPTAGKNPAQQEFGGLQTTGNHSLRRIIVFPTRLAGSGVSAA
jgi:hypothetical protein